ncbi:uncharacterized protein LOC129983910 [Argiope bruennichi]|uniref:uncharacterized protein LOC129983910 n=1 Tax=Argiope bruennichi TaxID=94029 RepID=UPI002494288B|nr:uncharacterized protein LOC129983910 [Argiope bruennichi]
MTAQKSEKNGGIDTIPSKSTAQKTAETPQKFWHINREMLRFKLHFFLFMGGLGSLMPYITIFAKNRIGISATSLASILTTQQFLSIFSKPLIGYIADYFNKLKVIICILTIVQTIFFFLLLTIPKIQKEDEYAIQSNHTHILNPYDYLNSSHLYLNCSTENDDILFSESALYFRNNEEIEYCLTSMSYLAKLFDECSNQDPEARDIDNEDLILDNNTEYSLLPKENSNSSLTISPYSNFLATCKICCNSTRKCQSIKCETPKDNQKKVSPIKKTVSDFETYQFWAFALLTTVATACTNGLFTLSDTACCESVEKNGAQFGRQRLFGAIGWGFVSPIGGLLNDYTSDFTAAWILMAVMSIISLLNILRLDLVKPQFSKNLLKDIGSVLRSKEFLAFKLCVFLNGICTGVLWYYLVWYLTVLGGSRFLCGMVQTVQCFVGELPCMFFSGWVIKKIGQFNVVTLALMSYCIRFFWYSYLCNPWYVLPAEGLSGITYGLFYPAVAVYAKLSAKPGTEATTQAVLFAAHEGLGAGVGCVVAGVGFDNLGGHTTFFILSMFAGCSMILSIILNLSFRRQKGSINVTSSQSIK